MPILNFTKWKADKVANGFRMTIRKRRKYPIKPGDRLYLYCGLRTKSCYPLYTPYNITAGGSIERHVICSSVDDININVSGVFVNGKKLKSMQRLALAMSDGFDNIHDFLEFFRSRYGDKFEGQIIRW